ncbi:MAG: hypothetical protein VR67_16450 [Peptococcaceae bacterium BRH_c8a]|nr:MAG: hypothetical protein VR67_16450 [Peptococcaceae bacterium BRH_c8a]
MTEAISSSSNDYYLPDKNKTKEQQGLADPAAFLKILVAQMKYQNPMQPQDSETFISQLTQMASMEQMYNMGQSMDKMATQYEMARYFQLIGQQVSLVNEDEIITGQVGGVTLLDDQPTFYLDGGFSGEHYTLDQVINITGNANDNSLLPYLDLVDRQVTVIDDNVEISGLVEKVLMQNGNVLITIDGSEYSVGQIIELHSRPEEETTTVPEVETETTEEIITEV